MYRAWGARQRARSKLEKKYSSIEPAIAATLWEKTIEDVSSGCGVVPWDLLSQFCLVEKTGCECQDSLCANRARYGPSTTVHVLGANFYGFMQEQLQVPSIDFVAVTVRRYMKRLTGGAWTVDEKSASRQILAHLEHWHLSM